MSGPTPVDPSRFEGLIEHIESRAGELKGGRRPEVDGVNRGYGLMYFEDDRGPAMSTVVSTGLRFHPLVSTLEAELVCTVLRDQFGAAHHLVDHTAGLMMTKGQGLEWGTLLTNESIVLTGTQISGMLATLHPYFDDEFNALQDSAGDHQLRLVTLVPATAAELRFADTHGEAALVDRWSEEATPLYDVTRAGAV